MKHKPKILFIGGDKCIAAAAPEKSTIIEKNCMEVYGEMASEGYTGLLEFVSKNNLNISVEWGGISKASGKYDLVFVSGIEMLAFDGKKYNLSMWSKNVDALRKLSPALAGTYLSADRISAYVAHAKCILLRDATLNPLFRIFSDKLKIPADLFKRVPQIIEVQRMRDNFSSECQPAFFDKDVATLAKSQKMKSSCLSMRKFYSDYVKSGAQKIPEHDLIIADVTKVAFMKY